LLIEAKQKVPEFLQNLGGEIPIDADTGEQKNFIFFNLNIFSKKFSFVNNRGGWLYILRWFGS
jgi:hypothetical protein